MNYEQVSSLQLPIGSGAMESSIRRVVNMRLKGPCIFWSEDSANEMLASFIVSATLLKKQPIPLYHADNKGESLTVI
jgi:hypothetical protein